MAAKLEVAPAGREPYEVRLGNTASIGRTQENTVCLPHSAQVSRQHAVIRCHNGWQYQLVDLGSRNGTWLEGARVVMPALLQEGAQIRIADTVLTFRTVAEEGGSASEEMTLAGTLPAAGVSAQPVAMLVCDIRGFSTMSERLGPTDLSQLLGAWFREAANLVHSHHGIVDKFLGDALFAYWSLPDTAHAAGEALAVARGLREKAADRRWPAGEAWRVAVALHHGPAMFSSLNASAGRDQTILGDAVNTVFRLEGVCKEVGCAVVLSGEFLAQLAEPPVVQDFGARELKGKSQLVHVYGLGDEAARTQAGPITVA